MFYFTGTNYNYKKLFMIFVFTNFVKLDPDQDVLVAGS